jgi:ABC-2 type transport system ATP-binding protein
VLEVCDLCRRFGDHHVLKGISMRLDRGHLLGLIGPNGAGKSTLLRCLLGIIRPDAGTVTIDGLDAVANSRKARRKIGYAPSETALYHRMTAGQLLQFALAFHDTADVKQGRVLLDHFGVPLNRRVRHLSHGMKRKILLAQALASNAPLLVLDEPMEALDPEAKRFVEGLLREAAAQGRAVLFSSHDLASTERLCNRIVFLHDGTVLRDGKAADLIQEAGHMLTLVLRNPMTQSELPSQPGWTWSGGLTRWSLLCDGPMEDTLSGLTSLPILSIRDGSESLEEVFSSLYVQGDRKS